MRNTLYGEHSRDLPFTSAMPAEETKFYARQRVEFERRAEFVRRYQRNRGQEGFQEVDPVLACHLGLRGR